MNSQKNRFWLIFGIICIVAGLALTLFSGFLAGGFKQLFTGSVYSPSEKNTTISQSFRSVKVGDAVADVQLLPSEDGSCRVYYGEDEKLHYRVTVENDTLIVEREDDSRFSFGRLGFLVSRKEVPVRIYLPAGSYDSLRIYTASGDVILSGDASWNTTRIQTASGDVRLQDLRTEALDVQTASGDMALNGLIAESLTLGTTSGEISLRGGELGALTINATSGDVLLDGSVCSGAAQIHTVSGEIELRGADAASFRIESTSGDVSGSLLSEKDFILSSTSGKLYSSGGRRGAGECRVSTTSGDVDLRVEP